MPPFLPYRRCPDAALIAAHRAGDPAAWEALIERYERFLFGLIRRSGLDGADAEDVFQNVCVKFYRHLDDLREMERLTGWLAAVARQEIRRHRRVAALSWEAGGFPEPAAPEAPPLEALLAEERALALRAAVAELPAPCRRLLAWLYQPEPLSYAEIARRLGVPVGSIGPRRARCLERLKKNWDRNGL